LTIVQGGRTVRIVNRTVDDPTDEETPVAAADPLSRVFAALADPTRRDIVARLAVGDAAVRELAEPHDISVQAVSKHLRVLEDAGLVSRPGEGARRPVHLEAEVFDLMTRWIERYRQQAEERFQRLDAVLAAMPDEPAPAPAPASSVRTTHRRAASGGTRRRGGAR
jgi:DNA-binding transcriptional ArsR family regulator